MAVDSGKGSTAFRRISTDGNGNRLSEAEATRLVQESLPNPADLPATPAQPARPLVWSERLTPNGGGGTFQLDTQTGERTRVQASEISDSITTGQGTQAFRRVTVDSAGNRISDAEATRLVQDSLPNPADLPATPAQPARPPVWSERLSPNGGGGTFQLDPETGERTRVTLGENGVARPFVPQPQPTAAAISINVREEIAADGSTIVGGNIRVDPATGQMTRIDPDRSIELEVRSAAPVVPVLDGLGGIIQHDARLGEKSFAAEPVIAAPAAAAQAPAESTQWGREERTAEASTAQQPATMTKETIAKLRSDPQLVRQLQQAASRSGDTTLGTTGKNKDGIDGDLGPKTIASLERLAKEAGIDPNKLTEMKQSPMTPEMTKFTAHVGGKILEGVRDTEVARGRADEQRTAQQSAAEAQPWGREARSTVAESPGTPAQQAAREGVAAAVRAMDERASSPDLSAMLKGAAFETPSWASPSQGATRDDEPQGARVGGTAVAQATGAQR